MSRRLLTIGLAALFAGTAVIGAGSSTGAITFGEPDGGRHPNVGSVIGTIPGVGSFQWCTGALIDPTVFLTAAHCFVDDDGIEFTDKGVEFTVSFDENLDVDLDGLVDDEVDRLTGDATPHPLFASGGSNETYDIAVFELEDDPGITPASLPAAGLLADKALKTATFTTVGFGTERDSKNGGNNSFLPGSRRKLAEQTINSVTKAWVTFSMNPSTGNGGTCYGDSGGPHFLGGKDQPNKTIVAITITGDTFCRSTDKTYRLDTPNARDFLDEFVTLP
jgi:secreted trypsin-like serine protease